MEETKTAMQLRTAVFGIGLMYIKAARAVWHEECQGRVPLIPEPGRR